MLLETQLCVQFCQLKRRKVYPAEMIFLGERKTKTLHPSYRIHCSNSHQLFTLKTVNKNCLYQCKPNRLLFVKKSYPCNQRVIISSVTVILTFQVQII